MGTGAWENGDELGDTWAARNAFRCGRRGRAAREWTVEAGGGWKMSLYSCQGGRVAWLAGRLVGSF